MSVCFQEIEGKRRSDGKKEAEKDKARDRESLRFCQRKEQMNEVFSSPVRTFHPAHRHGNLNDVWSVKLHTQQQKDMDTFLE